MTNLAASAEWIEKGEGKSKNTLERLLKYSEFELGYGPFVSVMLSSRRTETS